MPGLEEVDGVLLVAGWFRRHKEELARTMEVATVLDGDVGSQRSAATADR
jgi:hypothetical protein